LAPELTRMREAAFPVFRTGMRQFVAILCAVPQIWLCSPWPTPAAERWPQTLSARTVGHQPAFPQGRKNGFLKGPQKFWCPGRKN